jgi:hypothetical protein
MIEKRFGTLKGLEAPILIYESVQEADDAAKRPGAVLEEANNNLVYRGPLADAREAVCELLYSETGIERRKKDSKGNLQGSPEFGVGAKKDKKGELVVSDEAEGSYAEFVCAQKGWDDLKFLQARFDEMCKNRPETDNEGNPKRDEQGNPIVFALAADITQRVRISKPKVIAQKYLQTAEKVLSGKVDKFIAAFRAEVGKSLTLSGDRDKDLKAIALAARELCDVRERAALAAMPGVE